MSAGGKRPPMIFDESFARLDDERLLSMLRILRGEAGQSVILTSNVRELELLNKNSIPHKEIRI
jgi:recombinational DNA repair ATPase RecF